MNPLRALTIRRQFRRTLALSTPLMDGRETKRVAKVIGYDVATLEQLAVDRVVPFEPRETYASRVLDHF